MLVRTRRPGKKVVIGDGIRVPVVEVQGNRVRLGIDAPDQVRILRGELDCWQEEPTACDGPVVPACHVESKAPGRNGEGVSQASLP